MIAPIQQLDPILTALPSREITESPETQSMFGSLFQSAVDGVRQTDAEKSEQEYLLATGQLDNPAALMTALTKNELSVSLLVQLRNKALDAYSELTRMNL